MNSQDPILFWTMAAAVGQIVGAVATFAAVAVSLWIVVSERREQLRLNVGERLIVGNGDSLEVVTFEVTNTGLRSVRIISFGWRTGWASRGPKWLRFRWAYQFSDAGLPSMDPPFDLEPGHNASFMMRLERFKDERPANDHLFGARIVPVIGRIAPKICGTVHTARGTRLIVKVEKGLAGAFADIP